MDRTVAASALEDRTLDPDGTWREGEPPSALFLARQARDLGEAALRAGDTATAVRWFDRAHRIAPADRTLALSLGAACLGHDSARAANLLHEVAIADDARAAWLGLAAARLQCGDAAGAADALARVLARHVPDPALVEAEGGLADLVVRASGAAGWCGLTGNGRLILRSAVGAPIEISLDGTACRGTRLPRHWREAQTLAVSAGGRNLLGSPIQVPAIRRLTGFVEACDGGLQGWAWHPADPERDPVLLLHPHGGRKPLRIVARLTEVDVPFAPALARPRGFLVPAAMLAGLPRPFRMTGEDGADLLGSPLDPDAEQNAAAAGAAALARALHGRVPEPVACCPLPVLPADLPVPARPMGESRRRRHVAVVVPVHGQAATTLACLGRVLATVGAPHRVIVVDDASPDPELRAALARLAAQRRIRLLTLARNQGFAASANAGIAAAAGLDVVLLNSDTLVPDGWIERLHAAAYGAPGIGTVTPLSNNASIVSYPGAPGDNPVPDMAEIGKLDAAARRANKTETVEIPVGVGFCLYLRRDCIDTVGPLRPEIFAQGYGEENDFCLRARRLGWRHVAATGVFVGHIGGASFGLAGRHLQRRNEALLRRLHPGYDRLIAAFAAEDPLAGARRRLDLARWRGDGRGAAGAAILITHDDGGGVAHRVGLSAAAHRAAGLRPIVLRPEPSASGDAQVAVDGAAAGFPNLRYALGREMPALLRLLRGASPRLVEMHHTLHHDPAILTLVARLGVPYDVFVHDYVWFCPQVALVGAERRYCGEPGEAGCEACVADAGRIIGERIGIRDLRRRSAAFLTGARRVVAPSADAADRMRKHFPGLAVAVVPQGDDAALPDPPPPQPRDGRCRVCLLGAIGLHKGYEVLLACARDAAERNLPLEFVVVGHTIDDARLLATGRVFVTGRFDPAEADGLIRAQRASLGLFASIWPETWSFGLTELWRAGLQVAAFDLGAPADRIRATRRGLLLPLGLPPRGINNALVAAVGLTGHLGDRNVGEIPYATVPLSTLPLSTNPGTNATQAGRAHV